MDCHARHRPASLLPRHRRFGLLHQGCRAADRIRPPHRSGRGGRARRAVAQGPQGRGSARHSGRLRRIVSGRNPRALQSPPPAGRGLGRLRGVDRPCSPGRRGRARSRPDHRLRGLERARASARGAAGLGRRRTIPGRGGIADPPRPRQSDLLLAARDRAGADRGAGGDANALLLQELQRHRHAAALGARGDHPARLAGRPGPETPRARRGPAGIAAEPDGSHPRAGTSERGSESLGRGNPRDRRRAGAPGRRLKRGRGLPPASGRGAAPRRSSKPQKTKMTDATAPRTGLIQSVWANPILLLVLTTLIWAAHSIVGRLAVGQIGPMTLTCLRWGAALIPILIAARPSLRRDWPALRERWVYLTAMGMAGYTVFVALFYVAAHYTTALNLSIIQGAIPAMVLIGARAFLGVRFTALQALGAFITMLGVMVIAAQGDPARLAA